MKNNGQHTKNYKKKFQVVLSEKRKVFKEKYLTEKGNSKLKNELIKITFFKRLLMFFGFKFDNVLLHNQNIKEETWNKYGKNRYVINKNAKPIKIIKHIHN